LLSQRNISLWSRTTPRKHMKRHTALHVPLFLLHTKPYPCRVSNLSSFAALRSSGYNLLARLPSRVDNPPHRRPLVSATPIRSSLCSVISMTQRRTHSSQSETPKKKENQIAHTEDNHFHRDHSYSIFGHSHSHNGDNGHSHGTEHIVAALRGDKRALLPLTLNHFSPNVRHR